MMRRNAFTLIELLIAVAGSAVLLAALLVVLNVAWRLQDTADSREADARQRYELRQQIQQDLSATVAPVGILRGAFLVTTEGSDSARRDSVDFVAAIGATNDALSGSDLYALRYELVESEDDSGWDLLRTETRWQLAADLDEAYTEQTLTKAVQSFSISCYDGTDWVDGWDAAAFDNALPIAARVRIDFNEDVEGQTPTPLEVIITFSEQPRETIAANTAEVTR